MEKWGKSFKTATLNHLLSVVFIVLLTSWGRREGPAERKGFAFQRLWSEGKTTLSHLKVTGIMWVKSAWYTVYTVDSEYIFSMSYQSVICIQKAHSRESVESWLLTSSTLVQLAPWLTQKAQHFVLPFSHKWPATLSFSADFIGYIHTLFSVYSGVWLL